MGMFQPGWEASAMGSPAPPRPKKPCSGPTRAARWASASRRTAADPAGTMDGPNVYYYVKCRPNAETDMLGLETCGTNKVCCDLAGRYVSFCCGLTGAKLWGCKIFVDAGCKGLLGCQSCCDKDLDHCKDCCVLNISSVQEQFECIRSCIGAHEACRLECVGKS